MVYIRLIDVKLSKDELKEMEIGRNISKYYVRLYW
jgi:hypothetical protein